MTAVSLEIFSTITYSHEALLALSLGVACVLAVMMLRSRRQRRAIDELCQQNIQLIAAINTMPQGLCMFDGQQRIIVCNHKYASLYGLTPEMVKPGTWRRDMVERIVANGIRFADQGSESYLQERTEHVSNAVDKIHKLSDGRIIAVARRPLGGGWVATHEDITELKQREASFQLLFDNNLVPMWVYNREDLRFIAVNLAAVEHYGYDRAIFLSMSLPDLEADADLDYDVGHTALRPVEARLSATERHIKADGGLIEVAIYSRDLRYRGFAASLVSVIDMTERRAAERRIAHLAHHDTLTSLPNRAAFTQQLESALARAESSRQPFALLFVDLDFFKEINDVYGHVVGDGFLCAVSDRLASVAREHFVARIGGDEFVIIAEGGQPATPRALAERLIAISSEQIEIQHDKVETGSASESRSFPPMARMPRRCWRMRTRCCIAPRPTVVAGPISSTPRSTARPNDSLMLLRDLRQAIERSELLLHYQPQALMSGEIIGFEALVRWKHATRGMISPAEFIPLAEESGLISAIGEWVLRVACREAACWPAPLSIAVNLSPIQFRQKDLPQLVHLVLLETGLSPGRLELEITEGVLLNDSSRALSLLRRLKLLGVQIALDDFGTGYSSLSYLQTFPFDKIKIDAKFVSNLGSNPQSSTILRAVIALGHGLNMLVIAEGVETVEQHRFLAQENCDQAQGYLIGRPRPISEYHWTLGLQPCAATAART